MADRLRLLGREQDSKTRAAGWMWGRRSFVRGMGVVLALLGISRRKALASVVSSQEQPKSSSLDLAMLQAVGAAVLPSELGPGGTDRAVRDFASWASGYRSGAELLHGYGTGELAFAGASPIPAWRAQLVDLDRRSRERAGAGFVAAPVEQRREVIRSALAGQKLAAFPTPQSASHVVVGLLSWFYASPAATDLCYGAEIMKNACRPLAQNPQRPLPLRKGSPDGGPHGLLPGGTA